MALALPVVLAFGVLGAHFWRAGDTATLWLAWAAPLLLLVKRRWAAWALVAGLLAGAGEWGLTLWKLAGMRQMMGAPWLRMALILGGVGLATAAAALVFRARTFRERFATPPGTSLAASMVGFGLTFGLLAFLQGRVALPLLLADRFLPGLGRVEALGLAVYAAWLLDRMQDPRDSSRWRRRAWGLFSLVFFGQLALGLLGLDRFLMRGALHLPVPALVVAGPVFRGEGLFMPILFASTLLLVGPAWCSHLCYLGAWDSALAHRKKRPEYGASLSEPATGKTPGNTTRVRWRPWLRAGNLLLVVAAALVLRLADASVTTAALGAAALGLAGVAVMLAWSRRTGVMAHCAWYCPLGLVAAWAGRLSPFRVRIAPSCDQCGACTRVCRYDALCQDDVAARRPGLSCTLCGDCLAACPSRSLEYRFPGLSPSVARLAFLTLVVSLHAAFLGVARI
jgi:ferredoxin